MKKVKISTETKKIKRYERKDLIVVAQPVDILLTIEESKRILEKGYVVKNNYKGHNYLVTNSKTGFIVYEDNSIDTKDLYLENGVLYQVELIDNTKDALQDIMTEDEIPF